MAEAGSFLSRTWGDASDKSRPIDKRREMTKLQAGISQPESIRVDINVAREYAAFRQEIVSLPGISRQSKKDKQSSGLGEEVENIVGVAVQSSFQ